MAVSLVAALRKGPQGEEGAGLGLHSSHQLLGRSPNSRCSLKAGPASSRGDQQSQKREAAALRSQGPAAGRAWAEACSPHTRHVTPLGVNLGPTAPPPGGGEDGDRTCAQPETHREESPDRPKLRGMLQN